MGVKIQILFELLRIPNDKSLESPRKPDAQGQRERERVFRAIGLNVATRRDVILQARLSEQADVGSEIVLQTYTCTNRPLPWSMDGRLVGCLQYAMQVVACAQRRVDRNFHRHAEAAVEAPRLASVHIADALYGDAEVVNGLLLFDGIAV